MTDRIPDHPFRRTHLFTLRLWVEPVAADQAEIRGRVQHVLTGEALYFRTWPALLAFVEEKLAELEAKYPDSGKENQP
ncbi:MAG: hypothetical protein DCC55_29865 [Chloroflexi bacterium]|nr:MAG: hypothetical protein DCC55_29865 [Chloroflexota bacterium]